MPKFTSDNAAQYGALGGARTFERYGKEHMRTIGKLGLAAIVARHYGGDRRLAINSLIHKGLISQDPNPGNHAWTKDNIPDRIYRKDV